MSGVRWNGRDSRGLALPAFELSVETCMRSSVALIYLAMAVIAACGAAALYRLTPMPLEFAVFSGVSAFFAMAALDQAAARRADRKHFQEQLSFFELAQQDSFNEIDMVRSRLVSLETDTQQMIDQAVSPVFQDLQAVGALLGQVTEAVADADHRLVALEADGTTQNAQAATPSETGDNTPETNSFVRAADATPNLPSPSLPVRSETSASQNALSEDLLSDERSRALLKRVRVAVERENIEVALQSIVTLPHRRARAYATLFNLKLDGGGTLDARHAVPAVEAAGVAEDFDQAVMLRALALADRFAARDSASMVFVPVTGSAIMGARFADWLVDRLTEEKELAGRLVLEFSQKDVRSFTPLDFDLMGTLADLGYRMAVSNVSDARSDLFELSSHGFRYAKAPVSLFLGSQAGAQSDIHPEDLSDLAARNGMDLVVDHVESESQLVELIDFKLKYGQGNLFARPRVVDVQPRPPRAQKAAVAPDTQIDQKQPAPLRRADAGDLAAVRPSRSFSRSA